MNIYNYDARAEWSGNFKRPKQIGVDFLRMIKILSDIYPMPDGVTNSEWGVLDIDSDDESAPLTRYLDDFTDYVEHKMCTDEDDELDPSGGYWIFSGLDLEPISINRTSNLSFNLQDGSPVRNEFEFEIGGMTPPDPALVTYAFYKQALLGGLSIWPVDWANVRCLLSDATPAEACVDMTFPYSGFQMPWMCYLSAARAANVSAPVGVLTERTPDGGLLMIAAETRLDPHDPEHMKRSRILAEFMIAHVGEG